MNDYNLDLQKLFIEFMAKDQDLFVRVNGICEPQYFDKNIRIYRESVRNLLGVWRRERP